MMKIKYHFEDFTEKTYINLIKLAKTNYRLVSLSEYKTKGKICIWRHDVDFSVHRALTMARIEYNENVQSTYFFNLHSNFYNVFEKEITQLIFKIIDYGHAIALHCDPSYYTSPAQLGNGLEYHLKAEQRILEELFRVPIESLSFHSPEIGGYTNLNRDEIGGMINVYGPYLRNSFGYCSDSNGYWRFRRLKDVLAEASEERLQVNTHPSLWTPRVLAPRQRITRCIEGRAGNQHKFYDAFLTESNRKNIRHDSPLFEWLFALDEDLCLFIESLIARNKHHLAFIELWRVHARQLRKRGNSDKTEKKDIDASHDDYEISNERYNVFKKVSQINNDKLPVFDIDEYRYWSEIISKLITGDKNHSNDNIFDGILYIMKMIKMFEEF